MKLQQLKANPNNPRTIRDRNFHTLVDNLLRYPKFLEKRPIVHKENIVQGGNMRYRGLEHILKLSAAAFSELAEKNKLSDELIQKWTAIRKSKNVPDSWIANADDFTEEEVRAFIAIDNIPAGEWDMDALANEWNSVELAGWGLEYPASFGSSDPGNDDDMLPVGNGEGGDEDSGTDSKPRATGDDYSVFEQVMLHENKLELLEVLNSVKSEEGFDKLEDALMHIVRTYKQELS